MTDELELLKKDWQKKDKEFPKLSYDEIYNMLWKKSSSIVKWILIISIIEITLPHLLYLLPSARKNAEIYQALELANIILGLTIFQYLVVFYFVFQFYKRYKEISVLDNAKNLMAKIIKTRKTVKHYVIFCLASLLVIFIVLIFGIYLSDHIMDLYPIPENVDVSPEKYKRILMLAMGIFGVVFIIFMGGVYFLLYGLLLRKLKKNYRELERLEV